MTGQDPTLPILEIEDLSISYVTGQREIAAVKGFTARIMPAEVLGLTGGRACGKSTLALAVMQDLDANGRILRGSIRFRGRDLIGLSQDDLRELRGNDIAMICQGPAALLNPTMKVAQQLSEASINHHGASVAEARARALDAVADVNLPDPEGILNAYPHQLDLGQQLRVAIAMALMSGPGLLILDDPTATLDATVAAGVIDLVKARAQKSGTAILLMSRNPDLVRATCDRICVMRAGEMVDTGQTGDISGRAHQAQTQVQFRPTARPERGRSARPSTDQTVQSSPPGDVILKVETLSADQKVAENARSGTQKGSVKATEALSFELRASETLAIVGESGSGASALARVLMGLEAATDGQILLDDLNFENTPIAKRDVQTVSAIQMIFQNPFDTLNPSIHVGRQIIRTLEVFGHGNSAADRRHRMLELLNRVDLPDAVADLQPNQLNAAQAQRVSIARAISGRARILVAEEPVAALDPADQTAIIDLLIDIQRAENLALLFISQDLARVRQFSDQVMVLYLGHMVEAGSTDQAFAPPYHPYTEALLSTVPTADPHLNKRRIRLDGSAPSAINRPTGCPFQTRCRWKDQVPGRLCEKEVPPQKSLDMGHQIKCHLTDAQLARMEPVFHTDGRVDQWT